MIAGKVFFGYINLFSPNYYKKNGKITHKYFKNKYDRKNVRLGFRLKKLDEQEIVF